MATPDLQTHIRVLEERLMQPAVRADETALKTLLAEDFMEIGASGTVYDRAAIIAALNNDPDLPPPLLSDFTVRAIAGSVALATYQSGGYYRSSLWRLGEDGWRIVFHQASILPSDPP